jgi:signal transduction histidine kinase
LSTDSLSTSPLRPPRARQPQLAQWLSSRTRTICDAWIARVNAYPPSSSGRALPPPAQEQLRQVYDALCAGLESGRYSPFDASLAALTREGHRSGYRLSDLLYMIIALNDQIWEAGTAEFLPEQTVSFMQTSTNVLSRALTYVARVFNEEVQSGVAAELEQAQWRLAQLDRAKSSFIGVAAHELRTPITLIQGYSEILLNDLVDPTNERAMQIANGLVSGAKRLLKVVNDMIAVSMIDNEMLALHFQPTSLGHILHIVVADLKNEMADRDVAIEIAPLPGEIGSFYADPQRLYDALTHVVGNGVKYTPDGGHIHIETRLLSPGRGEEPVIEITIADDGIGIAPEHRERVFEKFYGTTDLMRHTSSRTKFRGGGPGLGLVVAKGIVDAHSGKIWLESPGYDEARRPGTTCHILLPMRKSPPEPHDRLHLDLKTGSN